MNVKKRLSSSLPVKNRKNHTSKKSDCFDSRKLRIKGQTSNRQTFYWETTAPGR